MALATFLMGDGVMVTIDLPAIAKVAPSATLMNETGTMDLPAITSVDPLDTLEGVAGTMDVPALTSVDPLDTLRGVAGTMDVPALTSVDPLDTLRSLAGTMDVPALTSVDPLDTLRSLAGTMDVPALASVDPLDTLRGLAGTMDVPALASVDPLDTLRGAPGTLDLPALNKVAPSDTLRGVPGTMDIPAITSVDPLDTLEGVAGTMDVPALTAVDPLDTLRGLAGTMDLPALNSILNNDTLRGVFGNWDVTNLGPGSEPNVMAPLAYGLGQVGTGGGGGGGPMITDISNVMLSTDGGQLVTISGFNFGAGMGTCSLGSIVAWGAIQVVVLTTPRAAGDFDFTLTDALAVSTTGSVRFADPPEVPEDFHGSSLSPSMIGLTWGFAKGSTGTDVYRSKHQTTGFARIAKNVQDNYYNDDDLHSEDTYYYYMLKSVSDILGIDSAFSDVVGVKTQSSVPEPTPTPGGLPRANTAISFADNQGLECDLDLAGDFTIMFWLKSTDSHCDVLNAFSIAIDNGSLTMRQNAQVISQRLNWTSGWVSLFIRRANDEITIGKNGVVLNTFLATSKPSFSGTLEIMKDEIGELFDLRIYNNAVSDDAYLYYYRDVTKNNGDAALPIWL